MMNDFEFHDFFVTTFTFLTLLTASFGTSI